MNQKNELIDEMAKLYDLAEKAGAMSEELVNGYFRLPAPVEGEVIVDYRRYRVRSSILEDYMTELRSGLQQAVLRLDSTV